MIKNTIQLILDGDNVIWRGGEFKGKSNHTNLVQVITSQPLTNIAQIILSIKDTVDVDKIQYLIPTAQKGGDVLSSSNPYFQDVALYNVFEVELKKELVSIVSKFRTGRVAVSVGFTSIEPSSDCVAYKGLFGLNAPLPTTGQVLGDYYECEDYNYVYGGKTYSKGMFIVWSGTAWVQDWFTIDLVTESVDMPIQPAVTGTYELTTDERNYLASIGADVALHTIAIAQAQADILDMLDGTKEFTQILLPDGTIIRYNATKKVIEHVFTDGTTLQVGLETWASVRNEQGSTLLNGQVVAVNGVVGQQMSAILANPSDDDLHFKEIGVVTEDGGIAVNQVGKVTHFGEVNNIPLANFEVTGVTYAENQELFVSVNGKLTNVEPVAPIAHIHAGWLLRVTGANATVFVYFVQVPHLDHLSDVEITTPQENDILIKGSDGVYRNSQRLVEAETDIDDLETFANTTVPATYETKADATSKLAEAKAYADSVVDSVYDYKGSVAFESLPTTGQKVGDTYNITNNFTLGGNDYLAGTDVAWNGTGWNALSSKTPNASEIKITAISGLDATHTQGALEELQTEKLGVDKVKTSFSTTPLDTNVISEKLAKDTLDLKVPKTDIINDLTTGGATKVLSAEQGKLLQDTKEALANKAIDFSVVNDTKYPTTKAVAERTFDKELLTFTLPNRVSNYIKFENGKYYRVQRVKKYTLQASDITTLITTNVNTDVAYVKQPDGWLYKGTTTFNEALYFPNYISSSATSFDSLSLIGYWSNRINGVVLGLIFAKGTYANLAAAQTALAGTDIYYQLATPIETEIDDIKTANWLYNLFNLDAWLTPTLTTATTTYLKYRKDNFGSVIIEGNITVTTAGTNFTLPTGYRPLFAYTVGNLTFNTNGTVVSSATGTQTLSVRFTGGA